MGAGREGLLDVGESHQASVESVFGKETGSQHDVRVAGVSAGSNGTNNDGSVVEVVLFTFILELNRLSGVLFSDTKSLESNFVCEAGGEIFFHVFKVNAVVGSLWAGEARLD